MRYSRGLLFVIGMCAAGTAFAQIEKAGPFIERSEPKDWLVRVHVSLTPATEVTEPTEQAPGASMTEAQSDDVTVSPRFDIEQATIFWPVPAQSASYEVDRRSITGSVTLAGETIDARMMILDKDSGGDPLHSGTAYAQWTFGNLSNVPASGVLTFEEAVRCWNTKFDEERARGVAWPRGEWPAEARSSLAPMLYIDSTLVPSRRETRVPDLVRKFTGGNPRSQPPVVVAKWIAGELAKSFRVSGSMTIADFVPGTPRQSAQSVGAIGGLNTAGAVEASQKLQGTPIDLALLLTACYRDAGLPARVVIGSIVEAADTGGDAFRTADKPERGLYAWVEFALYDETQSTPSDALTWVPVDILSMRASNIGRRPFDQAWPGFGTSDVLSEVVPLAYHLHPHQLGATSYGLTPRREPLPSLWGWNVAPKTPLAVRQAITITTTSPSRTTNTPIRGKE